MIKETAYEDNIPGWNDLSLRNSIKYVVFDPSFAGARPTITDFWFDNMFNLESITGLNYLNTEEVTSMRCMFCECQKLKSIDLSNFNTANVTNMAGMFMNSENLKNIYVGDDWSTDAVTKSDEMVLGCTSLVGGMGTAYDPNHVDAEYAHYDGGASNPGYFGEKPDFKLGDVNGDGLVDISDVTELIDAVLHGIPVDLSVGDMNFDGYIDVSDVTALISIVLGI